MDSYYHAANPTSQTASLNAAPAPPPPPPKSASHDSSRTGTPLQAASIGTQYNSYGTLPPPVPPSPSHAHALDLQQQRQYQQRQYQHQHQPHPLSQESQPQLHDQHSSPPPLPHVSSPTATVQALQQVSSPTSRYTTHPSHSQPQLPSAQMQSDWLPTSISSKSTVDLNALASFPEALTSLSHSHPAYQAATHQLQSAISANLELAAQVSALEQQVRSVRDQTAQLMLTHASLQTQWRRKQGEMEEVLAPWGPRGMYQRLVAGIAEQEAVLRAVHESFLESGGSEKEVTEWVKHIREGTTILEKRREMRARWDEGRVGGWR